MSWDTTALEKYEIFEGVMGNNLVTLLNCLSAKEVRAIPGEVLLEGELAEKKIALVLEGEILATDRDGKGVTLGQGELFGKDFLTEVKVMTPSRVLIFNHREVYTPCWFSCFFHAGFIENIEKASKRLGD